MKRKGGREGSREGARGYKFESNQIKKERL